MNKHLAVLLSSLFVVSIGFGISLPVLPFYAERLSMAAGATHKSMDMHVGLLTGVFSLMQLIFAPIWGRLSDRVGRRPLLLVGIAGYGIAQLLFGLATTLPMLYVARIIGGILASATLPAATAYVADCTSAAERGRGMAWLGTSVSLGAIAGPALGGLAVWRTLHWYTRLGHFTISTFSMPFFAAAGLTFLTLAVALRWLPESMTRTREGQLAKAAPRWRQIVVGLRSVLILSLVSQFGLTVFETVFALYAQTKLGYGPIQVGKAFMICGLVMALFQAAAVGYLSGKLTESAQIAIGFLLMGLGVMSLLLMRRELAVYSSVGAIALGMAFVSPNLSALASKRSGDQVGTGMGMQSATNNLGQVLGPLIGTALFAWQIDTPYLVTAVILITVGIWAALRPGFAVKKLHHGQHSAEHFV